MHFAGGYAYTVWSLECLILNPQDVLTKVIKGEGILALWKGFTPYYARLGPHTVLTFIFLEQMNKAYYTHVLGETQTKATI